MIGVMVPNVYAHILEPKVLFQDEHIKILDGGIGYSNIGLTSTGGDAGFRAGGGPAVWTDSANFFQVVNISDEYITNIVTGINTYDHKMKLLESRHYWLTSKWDALSPGESTFVQGWMSMRGWSCFELWVEGYTINSTEKDMQHSINSGLFSHNLEILQVNDNGKGMFTGVVKNTGEIKIGDVEVYLIKLDSNDNIISILVDQVGIISPDKSKKFEISAYLIGNQDDSEKGEILYREPHRVEVFAFGGNVEAIDASGNLYYDGVTSSNYFNSGSYKTIGNKDFATESSCSENKISIPTWVKNNAGWWAEGQIDDSAFVQGIQFMIKEGILNIPHISDSAASQELPDSKTASSVPTWVKNNAGWWAEGQIDDSAFVQGIEYLVKIGIIQVT